MSRLAHKHAREARKPSAHRNPRKKVAHVKKAVAHARHKAGREGVGAMIGRHASEAASGAGQLLGKMFHGDESGALTDILSTMGPGGLDRMGGGGRRGIFGGGHRRKNFGNVKALRRAMGRVEGFAKLAHKTIQFTTHHKLKGRKGRRSK
jgi:hypothetical protein